MSLVEDVDVYYSVQRRMLTLFDVWVTIVAITSSVEWLYDVKWRESGLNAFPCLLSVKWALNIFVECIACLAYVFEATFLAT